MSRIPTWLLSCVVFFGLTASARAQGVAPTGPLNVVIVADGAGNYQMASKSMRTTAACCNVPLQVETFVWSHGHRRILPDHCDQCHAREQGRLLAAQVLAVRTQHPDAHISLAGHSAGAMVILSATECLPPQSLDHVVLLSPSVSADYDIRPALRCVTGRMEVHYSGRDWVYLGLCMQFLGCADGKRGEAGGRVGFSLRVECPQDLELLPRLVQIPWQESFRQLGNDGGHYGAYQTEYLKAFVLPVLAAPGR